MKEIKFRAWDKRRKWMSRVRAMTFNNNETIHPTEVYAVMTIDPDGHFDDNNYPDDIILMQYTGLKDKNGKEIWQSDFIKGHGAGFSTTHSEVHFTHDGAQIEIGDRWIQLSKFIEIEVIGHKYENPELLKENK